MSGPANAVVLSRSGRFDIEGASRFGRIVPVFDRDPGPFSVDDVRDEVLRVLDEVSFDPGCDYFVLTGPIAPVAVAAAAALFKYGVLRLLIFDARADDYVVRVLHGRAAS